MQPEQSPPIPATNPEPPTAPVQPAATSAESVPVLPSAFALFGLSWNAFKLNIWPFVLGTLAPVVILIIPLALALASMSANSTSDVRVNYSASGSGSSPALNIAAILIGFVGLVAISIFYFPYMYLLKLQSARGVKTSLRANLKQSLPFVVRLILLYLLRGLVIVVGLILLIIPGVYMWRRYMLAPFYLLDENCGVIDAMKKCSAGTKPFSSAIWSMIGIYILMELVGFIPIVGWVVSVGATIAYCCAQAVRYLQIKHAKA